MKPVSMLYKTINAFFTAQSRHLTKKKTAVPIADAEFICPPRAKGTTFSLGYSKEKILPDDIDKKKYYIAVSYHISELGIVNNFEPDEMFNIAYTELSNRAESIRGGIYACGIESHILSTSELTEVIYIAVNRDDADIFNIKKVVDSDILSLSTTAKDVMAKKQDLIKEERRVRELQEEKERQVRLEIERELNEKEQRNQGKSTVDSSTMLQNQNDY